MKSTIFFSVIFAFTISASSCKKASTTTHNPDVHSAVIDSVSVAPSSGGTSTTAVDADNDGTTDFFMNAANDGGILTTTLDARQVRATTSFSTDGSAATMDFGDNAIIDSVSVPKGPGGPHHVVWDAYGSCSVVNGSSLSGFAGVGDFYIGFYITLSDGKHYGWLKLNIPADGKSVRLISLAYQLKPRTAIKAGEI